MEGYLSKRDQSKSKSSIKGKRDNQRLHSLKGTNSKANKNARSSKCKSSISSKSSQRIPAGVKQRFNK